jgi:hypothetical protein
MNKDLILMSSIFTMLLLPFCLAYIFISYVNTLENNEKCKCSYDIRRKYLKYYGYFLLMFSILSIFIIGFAVANPKFFILIKIIKLLSIFITAFCAYIIFDYSKILESKECPCTDSWKKIFIKYYSFIIIGIISLGFLSLLFIFFIHIFSGNDSIIKHLKNSLLGC